MKYVIAVFPNRIKAEEAYTALEKEELPMDRVSILGRGYKSADEFGFIDPKQQGIKGARRMAYWLLPFGFAAGYLFNVLTEIKLFGFSSEIGNHLLGGVFGTIAAAMGSVFVGGGVGLSVGSGDALPYRNRLNQGKYLIVVQGSESLTELGTKILRQFQPETIQRYEFL